MHWRLGLDLGTNSIGWCALKLNGQHLPEDVLASGVRLLTPNQEAGRDPQSKVSLAAERRDARSARRRRDRFLRRQKRLMELLVKEGLMPAGDCIGLRLQHSYAANVILFAKFCERIAELAPVPFHLCGKVDNARAFRG